MAWFDSFDDRFVSMAVSRLMVEQDQFLVKLLGSKSREKSHFGSNCLTSYFKQTKPTSGYTSVTIWFFSHLVIRTKIGEVKKYLLDLFGSSNFHVGTFNFLLEFSPLLPWSSMIQFDDLRICFIHGLVLQPPTT